MTISNASKLNTETTEKQTLSDILIEIGHYYGPLAKGTNTWEDFSNRAIADLLERYEDCPEALINYEQSDWVNLDECYTYDLIKRYENQREDILALFEVYCEMIGATSTLEALEGETIEDPEDMMACIVNKAMTCAGIDLWIAIQDYVNQ